MSNSRNLKEQLEPDAMSLLEHLDELRRRLVSVTITLVVTTLVCFIFAEQLVSWLAVPIGGIERLESIDVTENIQVFLRVSLLGGVVLAMPFILYHIIAFIVPGLTGSEKKVLFIGLPAATFLFLSGIAFAYFVMLPQAVPFLLGFLGIPTAPRPQTYFSFVTRLTFWIGVSFELPLVMGILARLGVTSPDFLVKNARYAMVLIAILAALITPTPDPLNMGLVMLPLVILYGLGIILARILYRPRPTFDD